VAALTALVVGSMIGSGIFALPSQMAGSAAPAALRVVLTECSMSYHCVASEEGSFADDAHRPPGTTVAETPVSALSPGCTAMAQRWGTSAAGTSPGAGRRRTGVHGSARMED
jgi:hypothetical protein